MPPGRLALALGLGLWLGALAGDPGRGCGPCAPPCQCGPAPGAACRVNCSGRGLRTLGPSLRIPAEATALDVSHNLLRALDMGLLANLSGLTELDVSNNKISALEEGTFANLFNLSDIDLSGNPLECGCGLAWLPRWARAQGVRLGQPEGTICAGPGPLAGQPLLSAPFLDSGCGEEYIACLPDNSSGASTLVAFSVAHEDPLAPEACSAFCFSTGQGLAALSEQGTCLCGVAQSPNASTACLSLCNGSPLPPTCGGPKLLPHVFPASPGATLESPRGALAAGRLAAFRVTALLPVSSVCWDFGDGSPEVVMAGATAMHRYLLPGHYSVKARLALGAASAQLASEVQVEAVPAVLELLCPASVRSHQGLELSLRNRGGTGLEVTYSIVALDEQPARAVHPLCPSGTEIYPGNGHCYRLVAEKAPWLQAQELCHTWAGAALAMVNSPDVQHFLVSQVTRGLDVWIGFSAVEGVEEAGASPRGEAFSLESCQNWLPGEPHPATAEHCVRLGPAGQCNTDLCSVPHSYVCELRPGGPVWDTETILVGAPSGDLEGPLSPLVQQETLEGPQAPVEVMVFPSLSLGHEAFLTVAEVGTQVLRWPAQLRLQVFRPTGAAGASENSSEPELGTQENGTTLAPTRVSEESWCPLGNTSKTLDPPHVPQACANSTPLAPGLDYTLWRELLLTVPSGPPTQYSIAVRGLDVSLLPGDLLALQHDAGPGAFLHCPLALSPSAPSVPYLSANASTWLTRLPTQLEKAPAGPACALRLLGATERLMPLLGSSPQPGLQRPGLYAVRATVASGVASYNLSCNFTVGSPVAGLRVVHPPTLDGHLYVPTNHSAVVLAVDMDGNATAMATARWPGGNTSAPFEAPCPAAVDALLPSCPQQPNGTLFSVLTLPGLSEGEHPVEVLVQSGDSQAHLSLRVTAQEPVRGLRAAPSPEARVLQGVLVRYSPTLEAGSDVAFQWTIDDKQSLTFHNVVFNVIYQSATTFKLSLTASNHVSHVTVHYNVSVERMNRMQGLWVSALPPVLPQNTTLALTASVLVDSAVEVAFLWTFGDGEQVLGQFQPPYDESFPVPEPTLAQVLVQHNATHTYVTPGDYNLTLLVSNTFENLTQQVPIRVRAALPALAVGVSSHVLVAGQPVIFFPLPTPMPGGILYIWDFGDSTPTRLQREPAANHTFSVRGTYHVRLEANNTLSCSVAQVEVHVLEAPRGLRVNLGPAAEQGAPVRVSATLEAGDNITWTFDMGDGTVLSGPEPTAQHVYLRAQNHTVTVTAASPAGRLALSQPMHVFVLEVLRLEPTGCIPTQPMASLTAHVTGDPAHYVFEWTFGDGSPNVTVRGSPVVTHNFTRSGTFPLVLVLSSHANKAHYFTSVCVEPGLGNVTLWPDHQFVRLGEAARLEARAWPPFSYRYTWDWGTEEAARLGAPEATHTYQETGSYLATVTASNNVSAGNDSALVEVQQPVVLEGICVNGSRMLEALQPYWFSAVGRRGSPAHYLWELGDGTRLEGPQVSHTYNRTGRFTISVAGWNEVSRGEAQLNVTVARRVQGLRINASRTVVPLNGSVSFSTALEAGSDAHYSWVLCDRCTPIPGGPTISYTFRSVGTFNIIVTAENAVGAAQDSIFVYVLQAIEGLQVAGSGGSGGGCFPTNHTLPLQATIRDGTNVSYSWTAQRAGGAMLAAAGRLFSLSVPEPGAYLIQLRATNLLGSATANRTLCFLDPVGVLAVAATPNPVAVHASVTLAAHLEGGSGIMFTWGLEGGPSWVTTDPATTHAFGSPGLHLVTVTAENALGAVNASVAVLVQVPVAGLTIGAGELNGGFVVAGTTIPFRGQLAAGTDVSWSWVVPGGRRLQGQQVTVAFPKAGTFLVQLNASNAVSWAVATHNLTAEEPVAGLVLWAGSKVVEPGQRVDFQVLLAAGSDVVLRLQVGGAEAEPLAGPRFWRSFPHAGDYMVSVRAENHVSRAQAQVRVAVLEAVAGLWTPHCCPPGVPTGTEQNFTARVLRGSRVQYAWYFSLQKVQGDSLVILSGREVTYTPVAAGLLEVQVRAFNELGGVNVTRRLEVQDVLQHVALHAGRLFANRSARFQADTSPSPRRVAFRWDFGDGAPTQATQEPWAAHAYLQPGDYRVQVNASNLVSFMVAQATVTVHVLACEEPTVDVALPPQVFMRRSQRNYLEAHVDLRGCVTYQTEYRWEVYRATSCQRPAQAAPLTLPGVDVSRPQLVLPRLVLPVGQYCFVFVVSFGDTPLSRSMQANVTVAPERLVPIIEGGSYRVWPDTQDLVLDGRRSYDPNLEDGDQTPLSFHWACTSTTASQSEASGCALSFGPRGNPVVTIPRERLEAGVEYTFDLTVWKAGRKEEVANQTVLIRSGRVPIVSLECVSCKAQAVYQVSRSSHLYLEGHCLNCSPGTKQGRWAARTFSNQTLVLDEASTSTGGAGMRLVVRRGALRDGEGYIFTLTVLGQSGGEEGCASIRLAPNRPPLGGSCHLSPLDGVHALTTEVHFACSGWRDAEDAGAPLLYALLLRRCRQGHCEEFCVYKGSLPAYGAVLPPGFPPQFTVYLAVLVWDQLGASVVALNRTLAIMPPEPPGGGSMGLTRWLHDLTESKLPGLLRQADPQHVIEYSLALVTVLNEYEQTPAAVAEPAQERQLRAQIRRNVTETLVSLRVDTVDDIQQVAAALAQCTVSRRELVCQPCLKKTLHKLEAMMGVLQAETTEGTETPTTIADSILNITGDLIHLASADVQGRPPGEPGVLGAAQPSLLVASRAYNLSSALMCILTRSRVLNEEPLTLAGEEIVAQGKRSDPLSLLCAGRAVSPACHFSIPAAFSGALAGRSEVVQLILLVDSNPFPFGYIGNYTVSTKVASMAFQTQAGHQIPIERLASERAITVTVPSNTGPGRSVPAAAITTVPPRASVSAEVVPESSNPAAALHLQLTFSVLDETYLSEEPEPYLAVYLHVAARPNQYNCSASRRISLQELASKDHRLYTLFIAPGTAEPGGSYHLNLTSHFHWSALEVSVGLYTSLCQYFSEEDMAWRTEGIVALEETSPQQAVCLTRHLTAFGASLLVPPSRITFVLPEPSAGMNYVVLLTCAVSLLTYAVMAVLLRKLDQMDVRRVRVIPFCGKGGCFKYEILVKTGWGRGSGTTAHVGIMLYGAESRSGHRHLDGSGAFHRNSLDIFQIATPHSLGSLWKIRVWHDNKGLSPAWFLQHVIVRDLQNARSTYFLVNDWLSVETEANGGLVEKEVLAANDAALRRFRRLLVAELQRGFFDKHIWLSLWDRPPRSRFTRVQRATCCVLLLCLFLGANAVWYGVVGDTAYSRKPVSMLVPLSVDTVAVGLVSSVVVYPVYLAILFLFRMSRSKVFAAEQMHDLFLDDSKSLVCWPPSEGSLSWPDLLADPSIMGSTMQQLAQGLPGRPLNQEEDSLSLVSPPSPAKYFSASDEDLIRQILAEGASSLAATQSPQLDADLLTSLSGTPGARTEALVLHRLGERGPPAPGPGWDQLPAPRCCGTGMMEGLRKRLLPAWCTHLAHGLSLLLVALCVGLSGWLGSGFAPHISVMWLLSSGSSLLVSFLGWEPLKVLLEALYFSLVVQRLHPDEDDTLVESPAVTPVSERVPRVRPPHGFALFLAKEEARKVKRLHAVLRNLLVYMLFLLVTLLANYGDVSCLGHAHRLQSAIKQELDSRAFLAITRSDELWPWMARVLLPYTHGQQSSPELGPPRLRQVRLEEAPCPDPPGSGTRPCSAAGGFSTSDYGIGWEHAPSNSSGTWAYSAPEALGVWHWGACAVYDSGGYVQELGQSLAESRAQLEFLRQHHWVDNRSRAVFVELTRYSPAVGLHAAVTLRLEFPVAGQALAALSVRPFSLQRLSTGLSLQLLASASLLLLALHFLVAEARAWRREGRGRAARPGAWVRGLLVVLAAAAALVRLAQLGAADRQWARFLGGRPRHFTSFEQVAQLGTVARGLAASLLFVLLVEAAQQLRFIRQWSVFGKTFCQALPELAGAAVALAVLAAAYTQLAILLVSSGMDSLRSAAQAFLLLCPAEPWRLSALLCSGLWALRLWGALRLGAVLLCWRYHALRGELYRPAWEPQDYEMVELFLRRLRLWMGFSKVKEFRHKVRFEGVEPLPSRSSHDSQAPPEAPPPSAGSDTSRPSTSSSQLEAGLGRPGPRGEPEPSRLPAVFEALLTQFDRLNQATEDVYQLERRLQGLHSCRPLASPAPGPQPALSGGLTKASRGIGLARAPRPSLRANKVRPSST